MANKKDGKAWVKEIMEKNMNTATPTDCSNFIHKTDKAALDALKAIPMFDKICSKVLSVINEPLRRVADMANKIHITEKQMPKIYFMVQSICKKIGIEMPDIYLELNREPNAYTYGTERIALTVNSGLLECLDDDELYAVLAHECGHIACKHVLYHTIGHLVIEGGHIAMSKVENILNTTFIGSLFATAVDTTLELAYYHWKRMSELSADRVAAFCCESAEPVIETMMRLAGGTLHLDEEIDRDLFIEQAEEYQKMTAGDELNKALEFWLNCSSSHPLLAVRAQQVRAWAATPVFNDAIGK